MTVKSGWIGCAVLCGWLLAGQAFADCTPAPKAHEMDFSICKDWPAYPGLKLTAAANFSPDPVYGESGTVGLYDLRLALVASADSKPLASFYQPSAFSVDAIALDELKFDTARYKLTPQLQAFGVRVRFKGSSRLNPLDETWLSLYVKDGNALRPVMDRLVVYEYGGEWDGNCAGERYETTRTVALAKTSSHGFADLMIKTIRSSTVGEGEGEACVSNTVTQKPVLTTLRYDGKNYVVPEDFKGL